MYPCGTSIFTPFNGRPLNAELYTVRYKRTDEDNSHVYSTLVQTAIIETLALDCTLYLDIHITYSYNCEFVSKMVEITIMEIWRQFKLCKEPLIRS